MTTGTRTLDSRTLESGLTDESSGSFPAQAFSGGIYEKTWAGGDSARRPYHYEVIPVPAAPYYWIRGKKVKWRNNTRYMYRRVYDTAFRQPNAYGMSVTRQYRTRHQWWCGTPPYVPFPGTYHSCTTPNLPNFTAYPHYGLVDSNRINKLVADLGNRIRGHSFEAAVAISQLPLALHMIADSASRIAMSIAYLRQGKYSKAARIIGAPPPKKQIGDGIASRILEVQYGWRPLINDVYNGAEAVAAMMHHDRKVVYKISTRKKIEIPKPNLSGITFTSRTAEHLYAITAYISESLGNQNLDLWDPAKVAWELLPYSFVCDWAFPIGQYLEARGAASRLTGTFVVSEVSRRRCEGVTLDTGGSVQYTKATRFVAGQMALWEELRTRRSVSNSLSSLPKLPVFRGFRKMLSWEHAVNAVALLTVAKSANPIAILRGGGNIIKQTAF